MKQTLFIIALVFACAELAVVGCQDDETSENEASDVSDDSSERDTVGGGLSEYVGRGTEACQAWQYSYCEFMYETCDIGSGTRERCLEQYSSMVCLSDEDALACAEALQNADCALPPSSCNFDTIVDPQPAIDGCNTLMDAYCERWLRCNLAESMEECRAELSATTFFCEDAIGLKLKYETCIEKIPAWECDELPPEECDHVVVGA